MIKNLLFTKIVILRIFQEFDLNLRLAHSMLNLRKIVVSVNIVQQVIANRHPELSVTY